MVCPFGALAEHHIVLPWPMLNRLFRMLPALLLLLAPPLPGCTKAGQERLPREAKAPTKRPSPVVKEAPSPPPAAATRGGAAGEPSLQLEMPGEKKPFSFSARPVRLFVPAVDTPRPPGLGPGGSKEAFISWVRKRREEYHGPAGPPTMLLEDIVIRELGEVQERIKEPASWDVYLAKILPPLAGKNVVDLAAGTGRLMPAWTLIANVRRVLMVDVDPVAIDIMASRAAHEPQLRPHRDRYIMLQDRPDDPCLPAGWADLVLCSNMHSWVILSDDSDLAKLGRFWQAVNAGLRKGGKLVLVDQCLDGGESCQAPPLEEKRTAVPHIAALSGIERQDFKVNLPKPGQWTAVFIRR